MKNFGEFYNNQIESAGTIILSRTQKLSQEKLVSVLGDDVEGLAERLTATVEVSRNYRSFSGLTDGMDAVSYTHLDVYKRQGVHRAAGPAGLRGGSQRYRHGHLHHEGL